MPWRRKWRIKWPYFVMYLFYFVAGILALRFPSQVIMTAMQYGIAYVWASFLLIGGGVSLYGILRDTWTGEIVGIPLAGSANAIFGVALIAYGTSSAAAPVGCIFIGISFGLLGRWIEVRHIAKISQERT